MGGIRLWARREMQSRLKSLAVLGVLGALVGGLALAAIAGARRTATVDARSRRASAASDVMIFPTQLNPPVRNADFSGIRRLPQVLDAGAFALAPIGLKEFPQLGGTLVAADAHLFETIEKPLMRSGRLMDPTRDDEVIITSAAATQFHLHIGSRVTIITSTDQMQAFSNNPPTGGPSIVAHVVGIGFPYMFRVFDPTSSAGYIVSPGVVLKHPEIAHSHQNLVLRLRPGTDTVAFRNEVAGLLKVPTIPLRNEADDVKRVTHGLNVERAALLGFALAVALAGLVLVGQALIRSVYAVAEAAPPLQALGATRREVVAGLILPFVIPAAAAAIGSIGIAVALSSRFPLGLGRQLEPDLGIHADWPVLLIGATVLALAVIGGAAGAGLRATSPAVRKATGTSRSLVMRLVRGTRSLPITIGAGLALDRGQGPRSLPVRPAIVGATAGVLGIVGAFGLIHGIDDSHSTPARSGQVWQAKVRDDQHSAAELASAVVADPAVDGVDSVRRTDLDVNGAGIPAYSLTPVRRGFAFVVLHGRAPVNDGEVVLGPSTAKALHRHIGGIVTIAGDRSRVFHVVGLGLMEQDPHASFDQGAWLTPAGMSSVVADNNNQDSLYVTFHHGVKTDAGIAALNNRVDGAEVDSIQLPPDVIYLHNVRSLPRALAAFLVLLGLAAVGHVLVTAVRRRRHDLAILRALGMRPRQTGACVAWQATTVTIIALAIGIPAGMASGRWTWRVIADATPLRYIAPVAVLAALITAPIALGLALLIAALPARRAARLQPAELLRTE